mgnify:CR=1 FL=1
MTTNPIRPGADWKASEQDFTDIRYEVAGGIAKLTICRPEVRNAFRPQTLFELRDAFEIARDDRVGVARAVAIDMFDRRFERIDDFDREDRAQEFGRVICFRRRDGRRDEPSSPVVTA